MELNNEFRVGQPTERVWEVLTDVERIAPCMPGAELQEVVDDEYRGVVRVKVGPITAQYKGVARFVEKDDEGHRAVLRAEGRETRGQGNANATVTAQLAADGDGTKVSVVTDLMITGRVAQFGRGVLADVSAKLLDQFVACLEQKLGDGNGEGAAAEGAEPSGNRETTAAKPVDLLEAAGGPVTKRLLLPVALVAAAGLWVVRRIRRLRRRRRRS